MLLNENTPNVGDVDREEAGFDGDEDEDEDEQSGVSATRGDSDSARL